MQNGEWLALNDAAPTAGGLPRRGNHQVKLVR